ncbi:hypothetical protein PAMP_022865 [Pampus punctatissimus]
MKNPHPLSNTWNRSNNKTPVLIPVPGTNKKFKRKSREPKRLFTSPEPERMKTFPSEMPDMDSIDDTQTEPCNVNTLAPLQRQLMISHEASTAGILSKIPEGKVTPSQSGAIDMRIGSMPAITSKLCKLPGSTFSNLEIAHWPAAISQPLTNRLKLGPRSTFPISTSTSSSHSPQTFSLEPSLSGQMATLPVPRASQTTQCREHVELQVHSPKESSRKRVGMTADEPGRLPEVKAIQQTRRLLANARERTRVHTISAAFEALRKQVSLTVYNQ